ncbi:hypothetical protein [Streptosporangium fragile]
MDAVEMRMHAEMDGADIARPRQSVVRLTKALRLPAADDRS